MARFSISPQQFTMVSYDAGRIETVLSELADKMGLPAELEVKIDIDESTPLGRCVLESTSPVVINVEGGAIEDPTRPRQLSDRNTVDAIGRLLYRAKDRLDPAFGDAPPEAELTLQQQTAWDAYALGRIERLGYDARKPRRQYHFRNRHGFSDVADQAFERLWSAESLTFADLDEACRQTQAARQPA